MKEFDIIDRFFKPIAGQTDHVVLGSGDDCAVLSLPAGHELCVSTDTLIEGVHFPKDCPGYIAAHRAFAACASDLAAMGADPHALVGALTLPAVDEAWLTGFSKRLKLLSDQQQLPIVGGNLSRGDLSITLTVLGRVPSGGAVSRAGANADDWVYVTGWPGRAAAGLTQYGTNPADTLLLAAYTEPTPRLDAGVGLRHIASSMIDVSDGLLADAGHIASQSGVCIELDVEQLPLAPLLAAFERQEAERLALTGGDDYELCFTASPQHNDAIQALSHSLDLPITRIGLVKPGDGVIVNTEVTGSGYQHF